MNVGVESTLALSAQCCGIDRENRCVLFNSLTYVYICIYIYIYIYIYIGSL